MRREPFEVDSFIHVVKRGTRGFPIVRNNADRWRFILMLRHFNDENISENWYRELMDEKISNTLARVPTWPNQKKIVNILGYCLLDNHFHLLLKEIIAGGVSRFMHKLGIGMTKAFNEKYQEKGTLFQGAYHSKTVTDDEYLKYVSVYIQVKNAFELYPGGIKKAMDNFEMAYEWATRYPYYSLGDYARVRKSPLIDMDLLEEMFTPKEYKSFAYDCMVGRSEFADMSKVEFE
ncbi:MAG: transposase [Patescibacteria group bacterium]